MLNKEKIMQKEIQKNNKTKFYRQIKKRCCQWVFIFLLQFISLLFYQNIAYATDANAVVEQVLQPFTVVKALAVAVVSAVGLIIIVKNLFSLGNSLQQQDSTGLSSALMGIGGGFIMAGAGVLIAAFGF